MAAIFLNDVSANPWILAEVGDVTPSPKNVHIKTLQYLERDNSTHVAEIHDSAGHLIARLTEDQPSSNDIGWVKGLKVERLDSGYVICTLCGH